MPKTGQHQEQESFPADTVGNGSRPPSSEEEQGTRRRTNWSATRKATGPRTPQGKERSKLNAVRHGLLFRAVLLKGESHDEYISLLSGLRENFQPQGKLEAVLVEDLATLFWRKRRIIQAEYGEISENIEFNGIDELMKRKVEAWKCSRAAISSGGLLMPSDNPSVLQEAINALELLRLTVTKVGFTEGSRILKKLYGEDQDGEIPFGPRLIYEVHAKSIRLDKEQGKQKDDSERRESMVESIDAQIEPLRKLMNLMEEYEQDRLRYRASAAVIPGQEVSERLVRYEAHLSREIDRVLNRLERLQRIRKGHPLPPQLDVNIT